MRWGRGGGVCRRVRLVATRAQGFDKRETSVKDLNGKVAFITGGASGIGLAMARAFGRRGMKVMIADIEGATLQAALNDLRSSQVNAEGVMVDVASRDSVRAGALETIARFGKVHLVCNNAGVGSADRSARCRLATGSG